MGDENVSLFDQVKAWFRREAADAREWGNAAAEKAHADLDLAERRISDDPEVRMGALQDDMAANDEALAALRDKVDGAEAVHLADADLAEGENDESDT